MTSRSYCFTLNNPDDNLEWTDPPIRYAIWQLEIGENDTPHYQGYLELRTPQRLAAMKRILPRAHFEARMGTRDQARSYASKTDTRFDGPWEFGTWTGGGQGTRNDVLALKSAIDAGASERQVWDDFPGLYLRHRQAISSAQRLISPPRLWKTHVTILYGPTGTGKTRFCADTYPDAYWKQNSNWWDGYSGHSTVVIDEYYGWLRWDILLRLLDRYPMMVETKGGNVNFVADRLLLTSNNLPSTWYKSPRMNFETFARRVDCWSFCPAEGEKYDFTNWAAFDYAVYNYAPPRLPQPDPQGFVDPYMIPASDTDDEQYATISQEETICESDSE